MAAPTWVSVFDLDRTLTRRGTYLRFLLFAAARLRPWRLAAAPLIPGLMLAYKAGLLSRTRLKARMHRLLLGPGLAGDDARRLADLFAARLFETGCYAQGRELIAAEQAAGSVVVIATAAPQLYAEPLARRLGVEHSVATRAVWSGDRLLSGIDGLNCYGEEKAARVARFLRDHGLDRPDVRLRLYSDDASDRPLFERCDDPVAVNATPALRRLAGANGWRTLDWRTPRRWA